MSHPQLALPPHGTGPASGAVPTPGGGSGPSEDVQLPQYQYLKLQ